MGWLSEDQARLGRLSKWAADFVPGEVGLPTVQKTARFGLTAPHRNRHPKREALSWRSHPIMVEGHHLSPVERLSLPDET